jgi:opacity protein-like surface antigen
MKAMLVAGAAAAILFAPVVGAQNRGFEGFSLGLNVNSASISSDFTASNLPRKIEQTSPNTSFQAIFGLPANGTFNFGFGMTYALSELKAGAATVGGVNYELIEKDAYSIFIEPGFTIADSTLVYGKLAHLGMRGETRLSTGSTQGNDFFGLGYGLGIRALAGRNWFVQAELLQNNYNERSSGALTIKPSSTMGTLGIGYKF